MSALKQVQIGTFSDGSAVQASYYEETIVGPFGPALVPDERGFDAAVVADKLISIIRRRFIKLEDQITLLDRYILLFNALTIFSSIVPSAIKSI